MEYIAQGGIQRFFSKRTVKGQEGAPQCSYTIPPSVIFIPTVFNSLKEKENEPGNNPDNKYQKNNPQQWTFCKG